MERETKAPKVELVECVRLRARLRVEACVARYREASTGCRGCPVGRWRSEEEVPRAS